MIGEVAIYDCFGTHYMQEGYMSTVSLHLVKCCHTKYCAKCQEMKNRCKYSTSQDIMTWESLG